jgi:serine/threonine-protein kinase
LILTDFGIARSAIVGQLTAAGSVLGTASYISPEQASGATATPLSDVYALGVVAYQCLSGRRPFEGDGPLEIAMKHVRDVPAPLPPDIPPPVREVVERAMAKDPAARYPSAAALGQVARRVGATLVTTVLNPGMPTSVPPVPAPISGGPRGSAQVPGSAPGGTRVLPGGVPPGPGLNRGTASAPPPPPRRPDTVSYYSAPVPTPRPPSRAGAVLIGLLIGLLVLVLLAGGWWLLRGRNTDNGSGGNSPSTAGGVAVECDKLSKLTLSAAKKELEKKGFRVDPKQVSGGKKNQVKEISPCPSAPANSTITVTYYSGNNSGTGGNDGDGGNGGGSGNGGSGNGGSSGSPTPTGRPSASCGGIGGGIGGPGCPTAAPSASGG